MAEEGQVRVIMSGGGGSSGGKGALAVKEALLMRQ